MGLHRIQLLEIQNGCTFIKYTEKQKFTQTKWRGKLRGIPRLSYRWSSPWDGPLWPEPSASRPWLVPSGPHSPSAWRWERRSPSLQPSPCWSGCLTAAAAQRTGGGKVTLILNFHKAKPFRQRLPVWAKLMKSNSPFILSGMCTELVFFSCYNCFFLGGGCNNCF